MREALKGFVKVHATKVYTATGAILASINHNLKQLAGGVNITLIFLFILLLIYSITAQSKVNIKTTWNAFKILCSYLPYVRPLMSKSSQGIDVNPDNSFT